LEHIVDGCLEKIRDKKNSKDKEISSIKSQILLLQEALPKKNSIETVEKEIEKLKIKLIENVNNIKEKDLKLEKLSKSDELLKVEQIKKEGKKAREDFENKQKNLHSQTQEWQNLIEKTEVSIKEDSQKILNYDTRISQIKEKIKLKQESVSKFNLKEHEDKLNEIEKQKLLKKEKELNIQKIREQLSQLISEISRLETLYNQNVENISKLTTQLNRLGKDGKFECFECKSLVSREHIENKIKEYESLKDLKTINYKKEERDKNKKELKSLEEEIIIIENNVNKSVNILNEIKQYEMDKNRLVEIKSDLESCEKNKQELTLSVQKNNEQKNLLIVKKEEIEKKHKDEMENLK